MAHQSSTEGRKVGGKHVAKPSGIMVSRQAAQLTKEFEQYTYTPSKTDVKPNNDHRIDWLRYRFGMFFKPFTKK